MSLFGALSKISEQIQSQRRRMDHNESATINVSVMPFIRALGYDTSNLDEVYPEFNADAKSSGGEKVDYAIFKGGKPIILIEAKAANIPLNESVWKQLHNYFNARDVRFGILTNGLKYQFYTDLKKRNIMDKEPFLTIDMLNLDGRLAGDLEGFTKSGFDTERILDGAQKRRIRRLLEREYEQPSADFIRHFARQVHSGRLADADLQRYGRLVKEAWRGMTEGVEKDNNDEPVNPKPKPSSSNDIPVFGYNETGISHNSKEIPVYGVWRGHSFEAILIFDESHHRNSRVTFDGLTAAPSQTALKAIRSVAPDFKAINGWVFWKLRDPNGNRERRISDLRNDNALVRRLQGKT